LPVFLFTEFSAAVHLSSVKPIAAKDSASAIPDLKLKLYIEAVSKSLKQFLFQRLLS